MTNVVTGHRQSFGTNSDVLAQQFTLMVGWIGKGGRGIKFPKSGNFAGLKLDSSVWYLVVPLFQGKKKRTSERLNGSVGDYFCLEGELADSERPG